MQVLAEQGWTLLGKNLMNTCVEGLQATALAAYFFIHLGLMDDTRCLSALVVLWNYWNLHTHFPDLIPHQ